jgi:hypothetical protein
MHEHPDLDQQKRQAKELLRAFLADEPKATVEVQGHYTRADRATFALHDALLVLAHSYGFESGPSSKSTSTASPFGALRMLSALDDLAQAREMLNSRPGLTNLAMSFGDARRPIHFAVMNRSPEMVCLLMQQGASARADVDPPPRRYDRLDAHQRPRLRRHRCPHRDRRASQMPPASKPQELPQFRGDEVAREWLRAHHATGTLTNPIRWDEGGLLTVAVKHNRPDCPTLLLDFGFDANECVSGGEGDWIAYS